MLPKLIGQYDSPFVRRVAVALQHYQIAYEHVPWSVWRDAEEIARYNPLRRVPTFVIPDGTVLIESFAILDHLDDVVGEARALLPRSGLERREGLRIAALASGVADKAVSLLYEFVLREGAMRSAVWADRCRSQLRDGLAVLESEVGRHGGVFCFGERLSHADVAVACAVRFVKEAHADVAVAIGPQLVAHAARCEKLPEFAAVVQPLTVTLR